MADEKNWQTVEEFIKQYKPVDEAMKELEEMRTSTALTTGTPANELLALFEEDPIYGPAFKRNNRNIFPPDAILLSSFAFTDKRETLDERTIIMNENQHLINTITRIKILMERNEHPETTAQLTDLQIAKMLAEKQGGIKTLWRQEFEKKYLDLVFLELDKDPEWALYYLRQSKFYKGYFNKLIAEGFWELTRTNRNSKWWRTNNISKAFSRQENALASNLTPFFKQFRNTLCKEFENSEQEMFFDVTLIGYISFMADLFTPDNYLGAEFLEIYVYYIFENQPTGTEVYNIGTIIGDRSITKNKKFMDMFNNAYQAFVSSLPIFYAEFKEPKDFINAYAQLLLRFLAENDLLNTHNAEDPTLLNETTRLTASILPLCERALDAHYLPAFYTSLPEGQ